MYSKITQMLSGHNFLKAESVSLAKVVFELSSLSNIAAGESS